MRWWQFSGIIFIIFILYVLIFVFQHPYFLVDKISWCRSLIRCPTFLVFFLQLPVYALIMTPLSSDLINTNCHFSWFNWAWTKFVWKSNQVKSSFRLVMPIFLNFKIDFTSTRFLKNWSQLKISFKKSIIGFRLIFQHSISPNFLWANKD